MVMMAARNTTALGTKTPRKPYTISRPRERWTADEHELFVHALLVFGRDWKTIEQFVGTKTATQIRSHAQKYFIKVQKLGLAAALPPPHPHRAAVFPTAGAADWAASCTHDGSFMAATSSGSDEAPVRGASPSEEMAWFADALLHQEETVQLPLSPDDVRFAEVYRFIGDVFGSGASRPVQAQLQRLHAMDPVVAETILLVLWNLEDHLCV